MHWDDDAIIIATQKYSEQDLIVKAFSYHQGLYSGIVKSNSKNLAIYQQGNIVSISWKARLPEHLGYFRAELNEAIYPFFYHDQLRITALSSICSLIAASLVERTPEEQFYLRLYDFLHNLKNGVTILQWLKKYVLLELSLLATLGFGLDLSECVATGSKDNLKYISPKSAKAVSHEAGLAYHDLLFPLPGFLLDHEADISTESLIKLLEMNAYFLNKHYFNTPYLKLPRERTRLVELIGNNAIDLVPSFR
jgi:DNA repair protein RecO (recombination protein O)